MGNLTRPTMNSKPSRPKANERKRKLTEDMDHMYCRELTTSVKKTKPLTMHDYKKFKLVNSIESKYKIGETLG
jgi:hypothetical protein